MIEKPFKHAHDYCLCERDSRCSLFKDCWPSGKFGIDLVEDQPSEARHENESPCETKTTSAQDDSLMIVNQDPGDQQ